MKGQTTFQRCAWCGDCAEGEIELEPSRKEIDKRGKIIFTRSVSAPVCHKYKEELSFGGPLRRSRSAKTQTESLF